MFLSVFDVFKIGIGPSSSHTMGPMVAANRYLDEILNGDWPRPTGYRISRLSVSLHGSLAFSGIVEEHGGSVISITKDVYYEDGLCRLVTYEVWYRAETAGQVSDITVAYGATRKRAA